MSMNDKSPPPVILDPRAQSVLEGARLEHLCTGAIWSEGPVWLAQDDAVLWSDIPNNRILRWSAQDGMTVWRNAVEFTNGHTLDRQGNLLHCSHGLRAITCTPLVEGRIDSDTTDTIIVDRYNGRRLNSPNDIVVRSDGTIWFTDPPYGILSDAEGHKAPRELQGNYVFCFDPRTGLLEIVTDYLEEPNGLAFSPDESILYVSDTSAALRKDGGGNHHIVGFDVHGSRLHKPRIVAVIEPGLADGFRVDRQGWIYTSSTDGVQLIHPDGTLLARIPVPEKVGNVTFGGPERKTLYIAASTSLYRIHLNTYGDR